MNNQTPKSSGFRLRDDVSPHVSPTPHPPPRHAVVAGPAASTHRSWRRFTIGPSPSTWRLRWSSLASTGTWTPWKSAFVTQLKDSSKYSTKKDTTESVEIYWFECVKGVWFQHWRYMLCLCWRYIRRWARVRVSWLPLSPSGDGMPEYVGSRSFIARRCCGVVRIDEGEARLFAGPRLYHVVVTTARRAAQPRTGARPTAPSGKSSGGKTRHRHKFTQMHRRRRRASHAGDCCGGEEVLRPPQ